MNEINGLPIMLGQHLDNLLATKILKSWTIHEGNQTVVTLRFTQCDRHIEGDVLINENETKTYKHVNRNGRQKARDIKRAANYKHNYGTRSNDQAEQPRNNSFDAMFHGYPHVFTSHLSPEAPVFQPCRNSPLLECPVSPPPTSGSGMNLSVTTTPCPDPIESLSPEENIPVPKEPEAPGCIADSEPEEILTEHSTPDIEMYAGSDHDKNTGSDNESQPPSDAVERVLSQDPPESKPWDGAVCHLCKSGADTMVLKKIGKGVMFLAICFTCQNSTSASEAQCVETRTDEKELLTTTKKKSKKKRK